MGVLLGTTAAANAQETSGSCGTNATWSYNTSTKVLTISGTGAMTNYSGGNAPWDSYSTQITSVSITGVTSIGINAFFLYSGLTSVSIGNSVTSIGSGAFQDCSGLTSINIPNSVTSIGNYAFYGCSGLTAINVDAANTTYCSVDGVLFNEAQDTLVVYPAGKQGAYIIPNSVTSIGNYAFYGCIGLTSVTLPNSVTSIGGSAFSYCSGLTGALTIPNSVTSIDDYAFYGCSGLTGALTIPNSVTSIGESVFSDCSGLTGALTIPNSVTSIGESAFSNCIGLTSVTIPNSVTSIGDYAFSRCNGLTSVTILNSATSIGEGAFYETAWYNSQPDGVVYIGNWLYEYKGTMPSGTTIDVRAETVGITGNAFYHCSGLTSVTIPNSVTSIGKSVFEGCTGLTSVTIPNSVTSIGNKAFSNCTGLTSVTIPNSVTSIGNNAFLGCSGLTSVTIPNSVTSIGGSAFHYCSGLTSITIPNSVTSIGNSAFQGCTGLTSVTNLNPTPQTINSNVFYSLPINSDTLYVLTGSLATYRAADVWKDFGTIIGIYDEAFLLDSIESLQAHIAALQAQLAALPDTVIQYQTDTVYVPQNIYIHDTITVIPAANISVSGATLFPSVFTPFNTEYMVNLSTVQPSIITITIGDINYAITVTQNNNLTAVVGTKNVSELSIYPNPTVNGQLIIDNEQWNAGDMVEIYNVNGGLVLSVPSTGSGTGSTITINIAHLPAGVYIVRVGTKVAKVVKQ
ncbi:hypothetical protein FACS189452_05980 [Bacteroidia bacterium]|nr:hypothetical protein FACS189452_05980 [Bacteroidia bacterium]